MRYQLGKASSLNETVALFLVFGADPCSFRSGFCELGLAEYLLVGVETL